MNKFATTLLFVPVGKKWINVSHIVAYYPCKLTGGIQINTSDGKSFTGDFSTESFSQLLRGEIKKLKGET